MKFTSLAYFASLVASSPLHLGPRTAEVSYDGHHVYSITPSSAQEARDIAKRFSTHHTHPIRDTLSVVIPPAEVEAFRALGLKARLVSADLGTLIRETDRVPTYKRSLHRRGELPDLSWFETYHAYADHLQYWDDLVNAFPENSEKFELGKSFENRTIYAYHLFGKGKGDEVEKPVILWHATVHAREVSDVV